MPDENQEDQNVEGQEETQPSAETQKPEIQELTSEQLEQAFKHPRFKELTEAKKERDKLMKEAKQREEEEMKRKGELEQLLEKREQEVNDLNSKFTTQAKNNAILAEAAKKGVVDPEAVVRLVDSDKIELDENGTPTNAAEIVDNLLQEKTYLVSKKQDMGSDTTTSINSDKPVYKHSELREKIANDVNWYKENQKKVDAAFAEGRVDMTA